MDKRTLNIGLLEAAKANDLPRVVKLLSEGADADYSHHVKGTWGASDDDCPLHHAVTHKNLEMTRALLLGGAKPSAKVGSTDWRGCGSRQSVFDMACHLGNSEFLRLFLTHGADPNIDNTS